MSKHWGEALLFCVLLVLAGLSGRAGAADRSNTTEAAEDADQASQDAGSGASHQQAGSIQRVDLQRVDLQRIEEVLVVGARMPRPVQDVVGTVDVIERAQLLEQVALRMSDLVRYTPGVSVAEADSRFGESEFTIRGLTGNRVLTLIDGVPAPDQFDIGAFSYAGQDYFSSEIISRIEILRGPASTLFGSDALGGVVAVVTRDPEAFLAGKRFRSEIATSYSGADESVQWSVNAGAGGDRLDSFVNFTRLKAQDLDHRAQSISDPQDHRRDNRLLKLRYALDSGNSLHLKVESLDEEANTNIHSVLGYGRRFRDTTRLEGNDKRNRRNMVLGYEFQPSRNWLSRGHLNLYNQQSEVGQKTIDERPGARTPSLIQRDFDYQFDNSGLTLDLESNWEDSMAAHRIGWGLSFQNTDIAELRDGESTNLETGSVTQSILGESFPLRDFPKSTVSEWAGYVHDEISIGNVTLIPAVRYEIYRLDTDVDAVYLEDNPATRAVDLNESAFAPKLGLNWKLKPGLNVYAQYARGFRAPPFEDVNIGLDIPLFNIRAIPNPDLKAETSDGLEFGLRYQGRAMEFSTALYGADYDDFIETKVNLGPDPATGVLLFQSRNIARARIYGAEMKFRLMLDKFLVGLSLEAQASWTHGENRADGAPLNTIDPAEAVVNMTWRRNQQLRLALTTTLVSRNDRVDESRQALFVPDSYAVTDFMASFKPRENIAIDVGVFNLFNQTYWRWASVRNRSVDDPMVPLLSAPGRYGSASLRITL